MGPAKDCGRGPERGPEIPPDIVISSSPTFSRRKNFKEAARRRSQEKLRLKRLSMEAEAGTKTGSITEEQTELLLEESSQFAVEEEKTDLVVEQSSQVTEFVAEDHSVEEVVVVEQSSESVVEEEIEQRMEAVVEQSSTITESVAVEEIEQKMEAAVEQYSQVTESVAVEEDETGDSVMSVVESSAGAERFHPSPSGTPGRNIPSTLSLPLERDPASTHFWTANSARKYY